MECFSRYFSSNSKWKSRRSYHPHSKSSTRKKPTPLPLTKLLVVLFIQFSQMFGQLVLFPFLPFMVQDFFPELSKEELGRKAGFLGSAYFIGSFAGSMMWGWISDTWGRRPAILCSYIGIMFSSLLFGFSQNFTTAVTARFLWGFLNGNVGVVKTYLSEILDDSNQAKGFSIYGLSSGIGRILSSVVGGFLSQPASKYSLFENNFFCKFKYVLPIFVDVGIAFLGFLTAIIFMEETLRKGQSNHPPVTSTSNDHQSTDSSSIDSNDTDIELIPLSVTNDSNSQTTEVETKIDTNTDDLTSDHIIDTNTDIDPLDDFINDSNTDIDPVDDYINDTNTDDANTDTDALLRYDLSFTIQHEPLPITRKIKTKLSGIDWLYPFKSFYKTQKEQLIECCFCFIRKPSTHQSTPFSLQLLLKKILNKITLMVKLLKDRRVILSILCYALTGGIMIMSNEILPLLLVTDHAHGGYNMDENEISMFIMISGFFVMVYQVLLYPRFVNLIGYRNMFRCTMAVFAVFTILIPWSNSITGPISESTAQNISGSGSGMSGSGMRPGDVGYCGYALSENSHNENSVTRLPFSVWAILLVALLPTLTARVTSTVTTIVLVNNSTLKATRGTVNGLGQSMVAIFRAIGPSFGALMFAWSEDNSLGWPLNYHLMFEVTALFAVATIGLSLCLPKSIEKKRV